MRKTSIKQSSAWKAAKTSHRPQENPPPLTKRSPYYQCVYEGEASTKNKPFAPNYVPTQGMIGDLTKVFKKHGYPQQGAIIVISMPPPTNEGISINEDKSPQVKETEEEQLEEFDRQLNSSYMELKLRETQLEITKSLNELRQEQIERESMQNAINELVLTKMEKAGIA